MTRDPILFGWDDTQNIVSVWADRNGVASIHQRENGRITLTRERFEAWVMTNTARTFEASRGSRDLVKCEELSHPIGEDGYRYLLSANKIQDIEDALVRGARRLDSAASRVSNLRDLGDEIYQVGPVEQYLMRSGKAYFGGMIFSDMSRMQVDLETTSLDPETGRIFMIAVRHGDFETTLEARDAEDEGNMIADLFELIASRDPDVIENHNLFGFDLPFLATRAGKWKVPFALGRDRAIAKPARAPGRGGARGQMRFRAPGRELIDTMDAVRAHDFVVRDLPSHGLKDVAKHFGLATTTRVYVRGSEIFTTYLRDPSRIRAYALDDVREVDGLSARLLPATFELARMAPRRYSELAAAGPAMGVLEPILVRGYFRQRAGLPPRARAGEEQTPHAGGSVHLFAKGIAEHVVKADVASLYPSLMRAFRIGPKSDRLHVLLAVVDQLLALRLEHKSKAKGHPRGSALASHHEALSTAMKLVLNSAYGYMGAGTMALFADRDAADEVTRRGRELLSGVLEDLRERGATLLEADTDGVYFAVQESTTEREERALVAAVAEALPAGIRLEYEGRYRSMLSYEIKNYALLTYGGELLVRGVAFRSSRLEAFGDRFLREALACVLRGDVAGAQKAFLSTLESLRDRLLPTVDVTTRVRITKTPEQYLSARKSHREAGYEALLGAGRSRWSPGERVRFYRARGNVYRLVTDSQFEDAPDPRDYDVPHYEAVLVRSFASRLVPAFRPEDWERLFRTSRQEGLFDQPVSDIKPLRVQLRTVENHCDSSVVVGISEPSVVRAWTVSVLSLSWSVSF